MNSSFCCDFIFLSEWSESGHIKVLEVSAAVVPFIISELKTTACHLLLYRYESLTCHLDTHLRPVIQVNDD